MRKLLVWALVAGLLCLPGAFAAPDPTLTDMASGPALWMWWLDVSLPLTSVVTIDNGGLPWTTGTLGVDWTASGPAGWSFTGNASLLEWVADGPGGEPEGSFGAFFAIPKGAVDILGGYSIEDASAPSPVTGTVHAPVVPIPEASTLALLAMGLFAGALMKRRK